MTCQLNQSSIPCQGSKLRKLMKNVEWNEPNVANDPSSQSFHQCPLFVRVVFKLDPLLPSDPKSRFPCCRLSQDGCWRSMALHAFLQSNQQNKCQSISIVRREEIVPEKQRGKEICSPRDVDPEDVRHAWLHLSSFSFAPQPRYPPTGRY